ncbi:MAG: hypothetical protein F6K65_02300 [Moorea sp. SIO3C2]|nr:hypothetical protein [Moorena sp. SIO3C2]
MAFWPFGHATRTATLREQPVEPSTFNLPYTERQRRTTFNLQPLQPSTSE